MLLNLPCPTMTQKCLSINVKIALLHNRYLEYQDVRINTVETTLNAETVFVILFHDFNMILSDKHFLFALKVQLHIVGALQVCDTNVSKFRIMLLTSLFLIPSQLLFISLWILSMF